MAFSQAVSGLNAASTNLDVIGNNIANSATNGFKSGSVAFADMYAGSKAGLGVTFSGITQDFSAGINTNTGRNLDVAITSRGFFRMVDDSGNVFYGRNGQFKTDQNNNLISMQGLAITGYPAAGTPPTIQQGADPSPLNISQDQMPARQTTPGRMVMNLNSADKLPTKTPFDPADPDTFNKSVSTTVYDSLGNEHTLKAYYVKTGDNQWDVYILDSSTANLAVLPTPPTLATSLTFNDSGVVTTVGSASPAGSQKISVPITSLNGSAAFNFDLDFAGSTHQNTGANTLVNASQDGYKPGNLIGYTINDDGTIVGNYSNERTQLLGQIALANFVNPEGLSPKGDNVWVATMASGDPMLGIAGTGTLGKLKSDAVESSNVDMSKELVNMIVAQRNYQSNAQTIKTQDSILNTLVNLR